MKTIKYLMLAFVAALTCVSFSSCSNDDEDPNKGIGNYYFQLTNVESNGLDANGNSIEKTLYDEWVKANNADSKGKIVIGKTDNETARTWFDKNISTLVQAYDEAYRGKNLLPEGVYIVYSFHLGSDAPYGGANAYASIEVTNSGARKR